MTRYTATGRPFRGTPETAVYDDVPGPTNYHRPVAPRRLPTDQRPMSGGEFLSIMRAWLRFVFWAVVAILFIIGAVHEVGRWLDGKPAGNFSMPAPITNSVVIR